jgi:hypothetical protein
MRASNTQVEAAVANGSLASSGQPVGQQVWWHRRWLIIVAASLVAFLLIFLRRPDALLNPQFLAEDGTSFYADAYNLGGLRALFLPIAGYLLVSDRLVGLIAVIFPVAWGPAIFNVCAILMEVAPVAFLLTRRLDHLIPNWYARGAIAFLYLAMPNSFELDASVNYLQWRLALLAFLVVVATPRSSLRWKVFDGAVILLIGLSGPFGLLLAPIILLRWLRTRNKQTLALLAIDLGDAVIQVAVLLANVATERGHGALGASAVDLARIVGGQLFVATTFGMSGYMRIALAGWWVAGWLPMLVAVAGVAVVGFALSKAPQELRLLWLFGALVLGGALLSPNTHGAGTYWQLMAHPVWNVRYEFYLIIAWLTTLVWILAKAWTIPTLRRVALVTLLVTCLLGIPLDWQYPAFADYHYQAYIQQFDHMPPGSRIVIPLNPVTQHWTMTLIKR